MCVCVCVCVCVYKRQIDKIELEYRVLDLEGFRCVFSRFLKMAKDSAARSWAGHSTRWEQLIKNL